MLKNGINQANERSHPHIRNYGHFRKKIIQAPKKIENASVRATYGALIQTLQ